MHYGVVKLSMLLNILQELRRSLVCAARLWITLVDAVRVVMTKLLTQARRDDWSSTYTLDMFRYRICTFLITSNTRQVPYS